jgi:ketosteroid isomerase-like protein
MKTAGVKTKTATQQCAANRAPGAEGWNKSCSIMRAGKLAELIGNLAASSDDNFRVADDPPRTPLHALGESAIDVRYMKRLTEDDVREIQQIHTSWIEFEVAGEDRRLLALCADDIEFWPPDAPPVLGRTAVSAQLASGSTKIHGIEVSGRRIRGSNETAYLTASYKTTFSSAEDSAPRDKPSEAICGYWKRGPLGGRLLS